MCEYCKDLPKEIDKNNLVEVLSTNGFVLYGSYVDGYKMIEANYCPVCGRELKH